MKHKKFLNKKGSMAITAIINIFLTIIVFIMLLNMVIISTQYLHLSKIGNEVARTIAIQSGLRTTTPANYPGGNNAYYTTSKLYDFLDKNMEESNFVNYYLKINGTMMSPTKSKSVDYRDQIDVELAAEYRWISLDAFIPGLSREKKYIVVNKVVYAEYRH